MAGWNYSWIAQLNWQADSWTAPVDIRRLRPADDTGRVTAEQVAALVGWLGADASVPLLVFDAGYDPIALSLDLARVRAQPRRGSAPTGSSSRPGRASGRYAGATRRHGKCFACADPATWPAPRRPFAPPTRATVGSRCRPGAGSTPASCVAAAGPANDEPPIVAGIVIRVAVEHLPKPTARAMTPGVRLPEQADRWTLLVVAAYTQLRFARGLVADCRLPWEPREGPTRSARRESAGVPPTGALPRHPGQATGTHQGGSGTAQRQSPRAATALPRDREGRLTDRLRRGRLERLALRPGWPCAARTPPLAQRHLRVRAGLALVRRVALVAGQGRVAVARRHARAPTCSTPRCGGADEDGRAATHRGVSSVRGAFEWRRYRITALAVASP